MFTIAQANLTAKLPATELNNCLQAFLESVLDDLPLAQPAKSALKLQIAFSGKIA
jgi:hypothetical protein